MTLTETETAAPEPSPIQLPLIEERLSALQRARDHHDIRERIFVINEGLHGNLGGVGDAAQFARLPASTRKMVCAYYTETAQTLVELAQSDSPHFPLADKRALFTRASQCYGRSALMLSGAGTLTPWHLGVVSVLIEHDLLPNVISGSSGGALIAGILGTHPPHERQAMLNSAGLTKIVDALMSAFVQGQPPAARSGSPLNALWQAGLTTLLPNLISVHVLQEFVISALPDLTFAEAYERSGLAINISITPSNIKGSSRLLNAITTPHVYVREAVLASCSVPGIFPPVALSAQGYDGQRRPYLQGSTWIDGSVGMELPARRLSRLYGVNHFIASQTNLLVLWAVQQSAQLRAGGNVGRTMADWLQQMFHANLKALQPLTALLSGPVPPLQSANHLFYALAGQEYSADINILPARNIVEVWDAMSPISRKTAWALIQHGQEQTQPHLHFMHHCTLIGRTLDRILSELNHE